MKDSVTYHKSHSFVQDNNKIECITQLYQIGIYCIINGNPSAQFCMCPRDMVKLEKRLKLREKKGVIANLKFGTPITVTDESGLWKEIK